MPLSNVILVVDDNADTREMLVAYLQVNGFIVHASPSGAIALALADALRPCVILMDLAMGGVDGLETTRRLRATASTSEATIVAVTAQVCAADREDAYRAGCNFFIPKPYDVATLTKFIDGLLHPSAAQPSTLPDRSPNSPTPST
jgi:CheY-like chemotaxis protein